jgi:hypothetical protein
VLRRMNHALKYYAYALDFPLLEIFDRRASR